MKAQYPMNASTSIAADRTLASGVCSAVGRPLACAAHPRPLAQPLIQRRRPGATQVPRIQRQNRNVVRAVQVELVRGSAVVIGISYASEVFDVRLVGGKVEIRI